MENIAPALLEWFYKNQRILPFRTDPSPYHVWLSEIMLQQTRVSAALPYYERFQPTTPPSALCPVSGTTRRGPSRPSASGWPSRRWTEMCCGCFPDCIMTPALLQNRR